MKNSVRFASVAFALVAGPAMAADMPVKAPVYKAPAVVAAYNWTGFYIGGNVGYGWARGSSDVVTFFDPPGVPVGSIPGESTRLNGIIGGGQAGYNIQFNNIVWGLEGDISGTGIKGSVTSPVFGYTATSNIEWLATGRGRLGVAFDRTLVYATGGVAVGSVKNTLDDVYGATIVTTTSTTTHVGWTVGAGVESALSFSPHWTVRIEYLYVDLGKKQNNHYEPSPPGWPQISYESKVTANIARVGFNYKF